MIVPHADALTGGCHFDEQCEGKGRLDLLQCPRCGLINPDSATRCDCGYNFVPGFSRDEPLASEDDWRHKRGGSTHYGTLSRKPGTLASVCPICGVRPVEVAKEAWVIRGLLVFSKFGSQTFIGCSDCVNKQVRGNLLSSFVLGWWCFPWGLLTPFVVIQNLHLLFAPKETFRHKLEETLLLAGVKIRDIEVGQDGLTREERRLIDAAYWVLSKAVWADGEADRRELDLAAQAIESLTDGMISRSVAYQKLSPNNANTVPAYLLPPDYRVILLRLAADVVAADGIVAERELETLVLIGHALDLPQEVVESILGLFYSIPGVSRGEDQEGSLSRACRILGVEPTTPPMQVRKAYRDLMLRYHPDRAGNDPQKSKECTERSVEINWAYSYLMKGQS